MRLLLVSTYELGRQPVHLASPAAALAAEGHEVRTVDLAVDELEDQDMAWADRVAISVPMHTATRLADEVVAALRVGRPELPIAVYGLYAGVGGAPVDARLEGEYEPALIRWLETGDGGPVRHLGRSSFRVPDRSELPGLESYARLEHEGETVLAGAVEASHGCRHRCRHCPIPAVYDGRMRVVPPAQVLADIDNLVAAGAGHITFGDADFLNAPAHSMGILEEAHRRHPELTFDATIKVEHIIRHRDLWRRLANSNVLFVISAFESVDDLTLEILDKGHTVADMSEAIEIVRGVGIHIRPTWLPFFPWTTTDDVAEVFQFLAGHQLGDTTDPVQLSIRLLVPRGSLLEDHPALQPHLRGYDEPSLTWRWEFADPGTAVLQKELETIAANASDCGQEAVPTLEEMRRAVGSRSGRALMPFRARRPAPRLTETWFCCAEPTAGQMTSVAIGSRR
ncbi:MAG TPA: radical SAM protein [Acidimicrobiia bacterium]|nr:radical SAM protein [Acidimicrobiia bacterium]